MVTSEHLFYACLRLHDQRHCALHRNLPVTAETVWSHLKQNPPSETSEDFSGVQLGDSGKVALERAVSEAAQRGCSVTGTDSLMRALLSETEGPVRSLLDASQTAGLFRVMEVRSCDDAPNQSAAPNMKIYVYICCFIFFALSSQGAEFDLGTHGTLSVTVPDGWSVNGKAANRPDGTSIGYAFAIKPRSDANAKCLLTFAYTTNGAPNKEVIHKEVLRTCEEFVSESVEKTKNLRDFSLEQGYGAYCLFTDASLVGKKAKPGDYKVMGSGVVQPADNMLGVVSLFADEADGEELKAMIKIIDSLKVKPKDAK